MFEKILLIFGIILLMILIVLFTYGCYELCIPLVIIEIIIALILGIIDVFKKEP